MPEEPLRIVCAPNAWKGALGAVAAAEAMARGAEAAGRALGRPVEAVRLPLSDGGDGWLESLRAALGSRVELMHAPARDPFGRWRQAHWGREGRRAIIEMSLASGMALLEASELDPRRASSHGLGDVLRAAVTAGCRELIVGLGGSASVDGGRGLLEALAREADPSVSPTSLLEAARADLSGVRILAAADVQSPLLGPGGTVRRFGPQKGVRPEDLGAFEALLTAWADDLDPSRRLRELPGAGAAGGVGFALAALGAELLPGAELCAELAGLDRQLAGARLALTGEGRLDAQTLEGKLPALVAKRGSRLGIPVVALAGQLGESWQGLLEHGLTAALSIASGPGDLAEAMAQTEANLERTSEQVVRLWLSARSAC